MTGRAGQSTAKPFFDVPPADWELGQTLWNYHRLDRDVTKSDVMLLMGSNDKRVAERAADLWHDRVAPLIVASGGTGKFTHTWDETEAVTFARVLSERGVPPSSILIEDRSANTAENLKFSLDLLSQRGQVARSITIVQKPFMERRALATADVVCPEIRCTVTSPQLAYDKYPCPELPASHILSTMVGDLDRVIRYGGLGWQAPQHVPDNVLRASAELKRRGYTNHELQ